MMNVKMINAFVDSTINVIKTMAFIESAAGAPYLKKGEAAHGDVSGIVGLYWIGGGIISGEFF